MSESIPERADVRQLRIQAKELLRSLRDGETAIEGVEPGQAKLADAQRFLARKYGFASWPKLVEQVETPALIEKFRNAVYEGDANALERLLKGKPALRKHVDDPIFPFDSPAIVRAANHAHAAKILPILVRFGADPNVRTKWWAGGFSALDSAQGETVDLLLSLGAKFDVWSAAAHGGIDVLRELLDKDPASVNAPGGDGERPLHFASTPEIAEFLIERGADLEQKDVDHEGTPIQYQVKNAEIVRVLLRAGAKPDIFTAAALNDADLARRILADDPQMANARVGHPPFVTRESEGGHIYAYRLGGTKTPQQVAADFGSQAVLEELLKHCSPASRLSAAAWTGDRETVFAMLSENPDLVKEMGGDAPSVTEAAQEGKTETVRILLEAGFDPLRPGMDSGTALHIACWFGYVEIVKLLIGKVPIDLRDKNHGSPPLGWAAHGAQWCRNPKGDYVGVVEALLAAGADPHEAANTGGTSMLDQAGLREDVKDVLRRFGAK